MVRGSTDAAFAEAHQDGVGRRRRAEAAEGVGRARSHCRFVLLRIHFIPYLLTYLVPLFLKRQWDRTLGVDGVLGQRRPATSRATSEQAPGRDPPPLPAIPDSGQQALKPCSWYRYRYQLILHEVPMKRTLDRAWGLTPSTGYAGDGKGLERPRGHARWARQIRPRGRRRQAQVRKKPCKLAQKLGPLQPFTRQCIHIGMHGPTCIFQASLTHFSLAARAVCPERTSCARQG